MTESNQTNVKAAQKNVECAQKYWTFGTSCAIAGWCDMPGLGGPQEGVAVRRNAALAIESLQRHACLEMVGIL
jgi:hypothetical protein